MIEKPPLPVHNQMETRLTKRKAFFIKSCLATFCTFIFLATYSATTFLINTWFPRAEPDNPDALCPIVPKAHPDGIHSPKLIQYILNDDKFHREERDRLLGAIQIPTEVYDDMEIPKSANDSESLLKLEPRWKPFYKLHEYLEKTYPLAHKHLKVEKINHLGLVYTWKGGDSDKKPIILAAHQDVVPVQKATLDQWTYPPFKGGFDGEYLFGRGVSDCKNLLIGLLTTIELLLERGEFKPERTIILAFGYDEESRGTGAAEISKHLLSRYGADSILQIIDEGNEAYEEIEGLKLILPATGEKGYLDSVIELYTPGGHSSVPPKHTSIGIMAQLITEIENDAFSPLLTQVNPLMGELFCLAEHSPILDKDVKRNILKAQVDANANKQVVEYLDANLETKYLITTSQAIDIVEGGVKSNALPEHVSILVNSRISVEESVQDVIDKYHFHIESIAKKFNLGFILNGEEVIAPGKQGYFNYSLVEPLEPAPVSPINGESWNLFGGALRYLYEDLVFPKSNDTFIVAPFLSTGNTDTKSYWDLSRNIYRYQPGLPFKHSGVHSVDERLLFDGHFHIIAFYYYYLQIIDEADDAKF
ncbi:hypothetical protein KGF57_004812 [Candida theae]|uniref:Peptidase M20 dimerisation domain-containing protein n=1 Tax=Candida theae TaxID=1198502 RepID=A0AAD5BB28_9ASCO|nr:uncharacterized protein KGF57_004812 [Candida theae]KAI5949214.1 hypothetical protein KGF57_004812 [Candida theae]